MTKNSLWSVQTGSLARLMIVATDSLRLAALALFCVSFLTAQAVDDTQLKQVIIFGRHSVRAPVADNGTLNTFSAQAFPVFSVPTGYLTPNGTALETSLGGYYRLWLTQEKLLTGNDAADANFVYFRANVLERTIASAQALAAGMLPAAKIQVNAYGPTQSDPLFDPLGAGVAKLNQQMALAAVSGRLGGDAESLVSAFAPELALTRSVLFGYPVGQTPSPATPQGKVDVTAAPFSLGPAGQSGWPVDPGGLELVFLATDPFLMEYADGMPASDVGWGQLNAAGINQVMRLYNLGMNLECRTTYLAQVAGSNLASHVERTLLQAATGNAMSGALGSPATKAIVLIGSDSQIHSFASLFHLDWLLPGYESDFCGPGGAVVFELRQSQSTGEYVVRASYIAQTLDQLRNRTPLTLNAPPAKAPIFIPGCSRGNATFDCPLAGFVTLAKQVIDPRSVDQTDTNH